MTIQQWLRKGEERLALGPHPDRAGQDALFLLMHATLLDHAALLARSNEVLLDEESSLYRRLLDRRAGGEPVQYIVGESEFYGLPFRLSSNVLIPRPETEHLVEMAVELAVRFEKPRIVDVGCGSGAIAVALAHKLPNAQVTATDYSMSALMTSRSNAQRNGVSERIRFFRGDLLAPLAGEKFDIVASNPPYVATTDRASLAVEVRDYEPAQALFAGEDGLDVIRRLIPEAFATLVPGGFFLMEFGYSQWPAISELLVASGFEQIEAVPDLQGIPRVACAQRP